MGVDAVSHFWQDLFSEGMKSRGPRLQRIGRIKEEWAPFAQDSQDSTIHFLVTGRMGFVWDEIEMPQEKGELVRDLSKSGTKIKAEGDFGHEPDLEIETAQVDDPDLIRYEKIKGRARKTFNPQMLHIATVKKCRVWSLNGKVFSWKDQAAYKPGYYKQVAECFQPYFDSINIGGNHAPAQTTDRPSSSVLFQTGDERSAHEEQIKRDIVLEKWKGTMQLIAGGTSNENTRKRAIIGEAISGTRSQTEFERKPLQEIQRCVNVLIVLEKRLAIDRPATDRDLRACCAMAAEDVDHPGKNTSFAEALTAGKPNDAADSQSVPF